MFKKIKNKILSWLGLRNQPAVIVYNGFGNEHTVHVMGHVLALGPRPRQTYSGNWLRNFFSVIRLFIISPLKDARLSVEWHGNTHHATSESDGFFRFEIPSETTLVPGWHEVVVTLLTGTAEPPVQGFGSIHIPYQTEVAFISDIDDTFLISYTSRLRRRLFVLLTRNERSRKPFEGVIHHYQLLADSGMPGRHSNPFFYVSSSEWNLYPFLLEFTRYNGLPKGVFLLGQMKRLRDFWRSGQNNHATKFARIVRIIEAYPLPRFVLLGDDSQKDPEIYESIVKHFPDKILAIYLRKVVAGNREKVAAIVENITAYGISCCYFEHSSEAVMHSKKIGLVTG